MSENSIDYDKLGNGLVPAIIQDYKTQQVLMLGFMNKEAFEQSQFSGKICFYSRTKQRLWTKGEESGNFLYIRSWSVDCDRDTLLFKVEPAGPVCHTGADTCFQERNESPRFLDTLEKLIDAKKGTDPSQSYTAKLFERGIPKIAQKVGEEAVEVVIEAMKQDREGFLNESADLMYHFLVLLRAQNLSLTEVEEVLKKRNQ